MVCRNIKNDKIMYNTIFLRRIVSFTLCLAMGIMLTPMVIVAWPYNPWWQNALNIFLVLSDFAIANWIYRKMAQEAKLQDEYIASMDRQLRLHFGLLKLLSDKEDATPNIDDSRLELISGWAARDSDGYLYFYNEKPDRDKEDGDFVEQHGDAMYLPDRLLAWLKWEDEPVKVDIIITPSTNGQGH